MNLGRTTFIANTILDQSQHAVMRRDCSVKPSFSCISPKLSINNHIVGLVHKTYDMIKGGSYVVHKISFARVLCFILMKDIGR